MSKNILKRILKGIELLRKQSLKMTKIPPLTFLFKFFFHTIYLIVFHPPPTHKSNSDLPRELVMSPVLTLTREEFLMVEI